MTPTIVDADLSDPRLVRFLQQHLEDMADTAPDESRHALNLSALTAPTVRLWVAEVGSAPAGTVALSRLEPDHVELKSMRTDPALRGRGIATALLEHVMVEARRWGAARISLETGSAEFFAPARALYARHGFRECPPFGAYVADPHSVFMTRDLPGPRN
ncbi:GNAT family N-acetyltransferase [Brachybacterium sp. GCM10030267]|uniref:GNAT family N-acetyltransferase n=1 Tax=unclassified Brachybacterium TaxID=2623841 RepID=UPI003607C372